MLENTAKFQSFDCEAATPSDNESRDNDADAARRAKRCRSLDHSAPYHAPSFQVFDCEAVEIAEGTPAPPRPPGKERRVPPDDAELGRGGDE